MLMSKNDTLKDFLYINCAQIKSSENSEMKVNQIHITEYQMGLSLHVPSTSHLFERHLLIFFTNTLIGRMGV